MLTCPIPTGAMPVVKILRRDVPRPTEAPRHIVSDILQWQLPGKGACCAMGLHPKSSNNPITAWYFIQSSNRLLDMAVRSFAWWWDQQTDGEAVVDAIWGVASAPLPLPTHSVA